MIEGCVLAGGRSSRMGMPKAEVVIDGKTLLRCAVETMRQVAQRVTIALSPGQALSEEFPAGVRAAFDQPSDDRDTTRASIIGLRTALSSSEAEYVAVLAVDLPNVTPDLFAYLQHVINDHDAAVPEQADGRLQALCAVYRREPCLEAVQSAIEKGEFSLHRLLEAIHVRKVSPEELSTHSIAANALVNLNTPDEVNSLRTDA